MKNMLFGVILSLALIACGYMQTDGVTEVWDAGFVLILALALMLIVGAGRDFHGIGDE